MLLRRRDLPNIRKSTAFIASAKLALVDCSATRR
jgi:hypothetical protein